MGVLADRSEKVSVQYDRDSDKIVVTGSTFKVAISITMDQLTSIYMGGKGEGRARVIVQNKE